MYIPQQIVTLPFYTCHTYPRNSSPFYFNINASIQTFSWIQHTQFINFIISVKLICLICTLLTMQIRILPTVTTYEFTDDGLTKPRSDCGEKWINNGLTMVSFFVLCSYELHKIHELCSLWGKNETSIYIYIYTYTHTHTYIWSVTSFKCHKLWEELSVNWHSSLIHFR